MTARLRAVVLDVDDTLVQTEAACFELENEVLARLGRAPMSREAHQATWGRPLLDAMAIRVPGLDLARFSAAHPVALAEWVESGRLDAITQDTLRVLDEIDSAGLRTFLLTSRTGSEVDHLSRRGHPLAARIEAIYHADATGVRKPDPAVFALFLADTGLDANECVYVGDSPEDAAAATGAGLWFIASLESGIRTRKDFAAYAVAAFIASLTDLPLAVRQLRPAG